MSFFTDKWRGEEFFKINDFHHVEFYVNNAKQAIFYYCNLFGLNVHAYKGPETKCFDSVSYVLKSKNLYFIFTSPLNSSHPSVKWLANHGEGVFDIAFSVDSVESAYNSCIENGAESYSEINRGFEEDSYITASIKTYGNTIHSFVEDANYTKCWAPGYKEISNDDDDDDDGLIRIDHVVANVEKGMMDVWRNFYHKIFGFMPFVKFDKTDITTEYSSLQSVVMRSKNWKIKLPINEPAEGIRKSQIQEYLDYEL